MGRSAGNTRGGTAPVGSVVLGYRRVDRLGRERFRQSTYSQPLSCTPAPSHAAQRSPQLKSNCLDPHRPPDPRSHDAVRCSKEARGQGRCWLDGTTYGRVERTTGPP
jgi:hypothetical protein